MFIDSFQSSSLLFALVAVSRRFGLVQCEGNDKKSVDGIVNILYHLIQFGSHVSQGLPNRQNVTLVMAIFIIIL